MRRALAAVRWVVRQVDGHDRWETYLRRCAAHGHAPLSRADFERRRADARAAVPGGRCC